MKSLLVDKQIPRWGKNIKRVAFFFFTSFTSLAIGLSPAPPMTFRVCNESVTWCFESEREGGVTVFEIQDGFKSRVAYTIPGWKRQIKMSENGQILLEALTWPAGKIGASKVDPEVPLFRVWYQGKNPRIVTLSDLKLTSFPRPDEWSLVRVISNFKFVGNKVVLNLANDTCLVLEHWGSGSALQVVPCELARQ